MTVRIYGIKNCNTMKKAFVWLDEAGVTYDFHDYKKTDIEADTLARWCAAVGHDVLINRRGTTWRKLSSEQQTINSDAEAIALMQAHTSMIRRPIIEADEELLIGFDADAYIAKLGG